ncbi:MAG: glycoside hydrolase family 26 protein [Bacteroidia bacterium]
MSLKTFFATVGLFTGITSAPAQLKFLIDDFEGLTEGMSDLKKNGIFTFGNIEASIDTKMPVQKNYSGMRCIFLEKKGKAAYGGWGKGVGLNMELNAATDHLNFYVFSPSENGPTTLKIELQEDDNGDTNYNKDTDDSWIWHQTIESKNKWELISVPLTQFKDDNPGGDGVFNVSYKDGRLNCVIMSFSSADPAKYKSWAFDFICFSKGKLPVEKENFDPPEIPGEGCSLGAWSKEGNTANFTDIPSSFESIFGTSSDKKLGVVHFFQPFAVDGGTMQNFYPSVDRINQIIDKGYIPMITLEDHFVNSHANAKQPNLYSIVEGHFDSFFADWAKEIGQVKGTVLLRILHEFNGDWYPWSVVNNDKNPQLLIKAYQRIHTIFKKQNVTNVKFIWCPNSMSVPQEKWNFIMEAYPGDEFVDIVALDIYNGAGKDISVWRTFRKEGIENYFILTDRLPQKPLIICETASRERLQGEPTAAQSKAEWIMQMAEALKSDMNKIKLLTWFNEKETFKVNTTPESKDAFLKYILKDPYFNSGTKELYQLLQD